jgi:hypothetical protein
MDRDVYAHELKGPGRGRCRGPSSTRRRATTKCRCAGATRARARVAPARVRTNRGATAAARRRSRACWPPVPTSTPPTTPGSCHCILRPARAPRRRCAARGLRCCGGDCPSACCPAAPARTPRATARAAVSRRLLTLPRCHVAGQVPVRERSRRQCAVRVRRAHRAAPSGGRPRPDLVPGFSRPAAPCSAAPAPCRLRPSQAGTRVPASGLRRERPQVEEGHNDCLEVLVAAGADLNARSCRVPCRR